jgi:hypothetical protein
VGKKCAGMPLKLGGASWFDCPFGSNLLKFKLKFHSAEMTKLDAKK